jgi:hypothetical protein
MQNKPSAPRRIFEKICPKIDLNRLQTPSMRQNENRLTSEPAQNAKGLLPREQAFCARKPSPEPGRYTLKEEPQPQVDFTCGLSNLNPAASSVST